jgi:HEAT repeat protein
VTAADPVARAAELAALGRQGPLDVAAERQALAAATGDPDPRARAAALGALARAGEPVAALTSLTTAADDGAPAVRRRVAELTPLLTSRANPAAASSAVDLLVGLLHDPDVTVVEAAAWALGELADHARARGASEALSALVRDHADPLVREAAVAALGALGDPAGLPAILAACADRPTVRRRAVLALAPFEGPDVDDALARALADRDWQVRQAAEDLRS